MLHIHCLWYIVHILHIVHTLHIMFIVHKVHISMYYICCTSMYILPILLLCPATGAREMLPQRRRRGRRLLRGVPGGGLPRAAGSARAAPLGRHTRANQHELASNEECTRTCWCRACWKGTGTACNPARWNRSVKNMHKYAKNIQIYVKDMHEICKYIDCISQICKRYPRNMPEICLNMHIICQCHYVP